MLVIGILGGIASGKSTVAEHFRRLGAEVIHADHIGHDVLCEQEVRQALRQRWGPEVFDGNGKVNRAEVARIVFAPPPDGPKQLAYLEQLTHPMIGRRMRQRIADLARRKGLKAVVLDAPLLLRAGWDEFCDKIVFVEASQKLRQQRILQRGWSDSDLSAREAAQESLDEKRTRADWIIDNSGPSEHVFAQVQQFWRCLD